IIAGKICPYTCCSLFFDVGPPNITPRCSAGEPVSFFAGPCDCMVFDLACGHTQLKLNMAAVFAGMTQDPRERCCRILAGSHKIRELLIFIAQFTSLELAMAGSPLNSLGEMAPVACGCHGTGMFVWARRQNFCATRDQSCSCGIHSGKSARRS